MSAISKMPQFGTRFDITIPLPRFVLETVDPGPESFGEYYVRPYIYCSVNQFWYRSRGPP